MILEFGEGKVGVITAEISKNNQRKCLSMCAFEKDVGPGNIGEYVQYCADGSIAVSSTPLENLQKISIVQLTRWAESNQNVVFTFKNTKSLDVVINALLRIKESMVKAKI